MKVEKTMIEGRFNLVDDTLDNEDRYILQLSTDELINLGKSIIELLK